MRMRFWRRHPLIAGAASDATPEPTTPPAPEAPASIMVRPAWQQRRAVDHSKPKPAKAAQRPA